MGADHGGSERPGAIRDTRYGKADVSVYRTYARPLSGLAPIPESAFVGCDNTLFACDVDVEVFGEHFLPAYTEGDNSTVVATDTMKNFVHLKALEYNGATLEGMLSFVGRELLRTYPAMESLRLRGRELPFARASVPNRDGFGPSGVLFERQRGDYAIATVDLRRDGSGVTIADHQCGRHGLQLIKITGSAFARFARDAYTTLPEVIDRPLFIYLDVEWQYADPNDAFARSEEMWRYVAAEQVGDVVRAVFHEFVSMSIQHLVHEMGQRLLARFTGLAQVSFEAQNRLWDTAGVSEADPRVKVYTDPRPPYGSIGLTLARS